MNHVADVGIMQITLTHNAELAGATTGIKSMTDDKLKTESKAATRREASVVERIVIPGDAQPIGKPPMSYRLNLGQPATVGELRKILSDYPDEEMLMFRNGPLPTFYLHVLRGDKFIEID